MWRVHETPCYPHSWKVNCSESPHAGDNAPYNFFRTREEAEAEARLRNARDAPLK